MAAVITLKAGWLTGLLARLWPKQPLCRLLKQRMREAMIVDESLSKNYKQFLAELGTLVQ
jgi:hypothetical protein